MTMKSTGVHLQQTGKGLMLAGLIFLAGCAAANQSANRPSEEFVEIENPALTMSPNAPATIWVPRSSVEKGVPRGKDLARQGYDAVMRPTAAPGAGARQQPAGAAQAAPSGTAPSAPAAQMAVPAQVPSPAAAAAEPDAPAAARITDTAGRKAALVPQFGLVVAQEGNRVYFNLGKEDGVAKGQSLKIYRGGTVVKGLGLAPGETVGTLEVQGFVGSNGAWGVMKQGGAARTNDLVGFE